MNDRQTQKNLNYIQLENEKKIKWCILQYTCRRTVIGVLVKMKNVERILTVYSNRQLINVVYSSPINRLGAFISQGMC